MKKFALTLTATALALFSFCQNFGEIHGTVKDFTTGEAIPFATVSTDYGGKLVGVTADLDGRFKLKPLHPGTYDLKFQYLGYDPKTVQGIEVTPNKIYVLGSVELATNNQLPTFVVEGIKLFDNYGQSIVEPMSEHLIIIKVITLYRKITLIFIMKLIMLCLITIHL